MRQHVKSKNKDIQRKLATLNASRQNNRQPMPRPAVFADKTKYSRSREKQRLGREYLMA